ncbi:DUF3566 domain-containing protein [Streptomyces phaeolivaceus]|uniref:DUF3566 domain-containing protein n=1 Tax=Streptomyces phaeolivaceus TaxID=2653200 RepID=A0A5P8K6U5_9ACTN|nr:DUF3566 domain-containing protein [Streptomyces phaeolivaceus]QFQ98770.1 DUF3566 domain-containing protein [Streptomyces phaeolivaceus]
MSGATGAGSSGTSAGTSTGSEADGDGRGSAARAMDSHTTQLKAIKPSAADAAAPSSEKSGSQKSGSQGGTVTDTRGPQTQQPAPGTPAAAPGGPGRQQAPAQPQPPAQPQVQAGGSALPGERQAQQQAGPYHPPQAYQPAPEPSSRKPRTGARTTPRTRKARLRVAKADPWSVMKVSFLLSIALGICTVVAAAVLWMVMNAMGVFSTVGATISEATGSNESNGFDLQAFLSLPNVLIFTTVIAVIDVVLATALATLGAFIYNLSAGFVGGIELTLAEDE